MMLNSGIDISLGSGWKSKLTAKPSKKILKIKKNSGEDQIKAAETVTYKKRGRTNWSLYIKEIFRKS